MSREGKYKSMMRRFAAVIPLVILLCAIFVVPTAAVSAVSEEEYDNFIISLPNSAKQYLPKGANDAAETAEALIDWRTLLEAVGGIIGGGISDILPMTAGVCGLLLLAAVMNAVKTAISSQETAKMLSFCTTCAVAAAAVTMQYYILESAVAYLSDLSVLVNAILPLNLSLYAAGGNVASASVSATAFAVFLNLSENFLSVTVVPFAAVCMALNVASAVPSGVSLNGLAAAIRRTYTYALTFISTMLCAILAAQNAIAAAGDSVSLRAAKFVAGSAIPVVGGSVGESLKTLSSGVILLRKSVGITGIMLILLTFLPTLVSLIAARLSLSLTAALAEMLGCDNEKRLLSGISDIYGCIAAVTCVCSLTFVFALILLVTAATAV